MNARVWNPEPTMELGSGIVFVATPTTWPLLLPALAMLSNPPSGRAPRSMIRPCSQRVARTSGKPGIKGSISPFWESPAISPFELIQLAALLAPLGSAPKSILAPFFQTKVCAVTQSSVKQNAGNGSGVEDSAQPVTDPPLFRTMA